MKRLALALLLVASTAEAQFTNFAHHATASAGHANGLPATSAVGPYSGTPVLGDMIVFDGTNWISIPKGTNTQVLTENTNGIPTWQSSAAGSAFSAITSGTNTTAAMICGTGCSITTSGSGSNTASAIAVGGITGLGSGVATWLATPTAANFASALSGSVTVPAGGTGAATFTAHGVMVGEGTGPLVPTAAGASGQMLVGNDSADPTYQTFPYDLTKWDIINTSFWQHGSSAGAAVINAFNINVTGTAAGYVTAPALTPDANHPNIAELTTGSTATGGTTIGGGVTTTSGIQAGFPLSGNEVLDWLVYLPVVSGGTNTTRLSVGFMDTVGNAAILNGAFITWDNNSDTHWAVETIKAGVATGPTASTTVATAAAWHHLRIVVNSNATSIAFSVDGVALSSSPLTTNIPVISIWPGVKYVASAGCAAATTCVVDLNTVYFRKSVTR